MRKLIINADDFGYTKGINRGIIEGVNAGIITSTSLMVNEEYAEGVISIKHNPKISIGLHFVVPNNKHLALESFEVQLQKFKDLVGRKPDHIDSHKILPRDIPGFEDFLSNYSKEQSTPVRDWGHAKLIESFFGLYLDGSGNLNEDKISPKNFISILDNEVTKGYNELMCHAGYADDELRSKSSYNDSREIELKTLLSDEVKSYIERNDIKLISWRDVTI